MDFADRPEHSHARAPVLATASALNLLGPTLIHWGTEEQKKRHLPNILSVDGIWCQGYSEPDAGAAVAMAAANHRRPRENGARLDRAQSALGRSRHWLGGA